MTKHSPEPQAPRLAAFFKTREEMEASERAVLAPFAEKSGDSRGRQYSEPSHAFRTEFQRDRARIIHSRAFRRMEYKTQVFLNGTGDHLRTRLTHSIEVASISRTIARALRLNEDLAEAIALAHDLGHAPFGHSGEEMLAECMRDHGGFDHNRQSVRVVELLEDPYPNFPGLNLTFEVREGLRKHGAFHDMAEVTGAQAPAALQSYRCPSLEAQVADLADEITYYSHDLDDAVDFEILDRGTTGKKRGLASKPAGCAGTLPRRSGAGTAQANHSRHYRHGSARSGLDQHKIHCRCRRPKCRRSAAAASAPDSL